jgi:DNA-binding response OmpR family regulator
MPIEIVLVEDSVSDAILFEEALKTVSGPYELTVYSSPDVFLNEVKSGSAIKYDIAVLDVDLGAISGLEILKKLKEDERYSDLPVIMYTGHDHSSIVIQALKCGAQNYIVKSADLSTLEAALGIELVKAAFKGIRKKTSFESPEDKE